MLRTKQNLALICFSHFHNVRKQTKHQRRNSSFKDLVFLREDALFSLFPGKLPIFLILLSRTLYLREVCVKFSRSVVSASWWPKQPTALHWFTCGTTHPFIFLQSRFLDLSVAFAIALSKLEPEAVNGRTFIKICQYPPIQQSAHSVSFPRFPKPVQRRLKTRQKLRILANLLIS